MNKKPIIVSISSYNENDIKGINGYLSSFNNLNSTKYDLLFIENFPYYPHDELYNEFDRLKDFGGYIVKENTAYKNNVGRFFQMEKLLSDLFPDFMHRYILFTDTYDVVFQKDFYEDIEKSFDVGTFIDVAPEGELHKDSWVWNKVCTDNQLNFMQLLANREIYNAGTWGMLGITFIRFINFLKDKLESYNYLPFSDQPIFNEFIEQEEVRGFEIRKNPEFMSCLYKNHENGNIIKTDGKFYTKDNKLISIVHGNGNCKGLLNG